MMSLLDAESGRQTLRQREHQRQHMLGHDWSMHAAGIGDHDPAVHDLGYQQLMNRRRSRVNPAQTRRCLHLLAIQRPRNDHLRITQIVFNSLEW